MELHSNQTTFAQQRRLAVLKLLAEGKRLRGSELAKALNTDIHHTIKYLLDERKITRHKDKHITYEISELGKSELGLDVNRVAQRKEVAPTSTQQIFVPTQTMGSNRPGCNDHTKCPSILQGKKIDYTDHKIYMVSKIGTEINYDEPL